MKNLNMLMMVALTIASRSLSAQVSNNPCSAHQAISAVKRSTSTTINQSLKEKMKAGIVKIFSAPLHPESQVAGGNANIYSASPVNLSLKENLKMETMKLYSQPAKGYASVEKICKCMNCGMDCKDMDCSGMKPGCMAHEKTTGKAGRCAACGVTSNLSAKERMKMDVIKI